MKRYFRITLITGEHHDLDFHDVFIQDRFIPHLKANDLRLLVAAKELASGGFAKPGETERPCIIAPSQVKSVEVVIEEDPKPELNIETLPQ